MKTLLWKDATLEWRGRDALSHGLVLVLLFAVLMLFARPERLTIALWAPMLYGGIVASGRGLAAEVDHGTLRLLQAAPVPLAWHGASRTIVNLAVVLVIAGTSVAVGKLLWGIRSTPDLLFGLFLASVGIAVVGTLVGGLAAQASARGFLLPILAVPALAPLIQAGVTATAGALAAEHQLLAPWLLLAGYDLLAIGVAALIWPFVLEAD